MSWHRPNIGSRMNREVHVRVWERAEVKFLRATRHTGEERSTQLTLTVRDNGRGIDPTAPTGFGIRGMQERVQALGGSYKVESEAGRGTWVQILIPLDHRTPPA